MKKLFTLLALLTCFLGAKAGTVVDAEVDFSQMADGSEIKFYGWGASESARARLSIVNGCLHFESSEATDPSWDCQFHPIGGVSAEADQTYILHFKIKGDHEGNVSMLGFGQTPYGQFAITTDWVEGTVEYLCTDASSGNILMQCGDWVGTWDIAYLKITHEEADERPVQWQSIVTNSGADTAWPDPVPTILSETGETWDASVVAWGKEWGYMPKEADGLPTIHAAIIEEDNGNKVFACHAKAVEPPLTFEVETEQWGTTYHVGDEKPDNTWQNQFWIGFPRAMKSGEQIKVSFKYKASENVSVSTQSHGKPGDYISGGSIGNMSFTTEWQEFEKTISCDEGMQSIAFNVTGENNNWKKDMDFYFDDIVVSEMVLEHGYFVAATNPENGIEYNFDSATKFVEADENMFTATVGTEGKQDSWVNEIMISTVCGNTKAFKSATLKVTEAVKNDPDTWISYTTGSNAKIKLPVAGVWRIIIATEYEQMSFEKLEGEPDKEAVEIVANPNTVIVNGQERQDLVDNRNQDGTITVREEADDPAGENVGGEGHEGQTWDNQFFIVANRTLAAGEETVISFKYKSTVAAKTTTQNHVAPGAYKDWNSIGDVNFTTDEQEFEKTFTIPEAADGMQSIAFNMAEIKEACTYYVYDIIWKLADGTESLIDMEGTTSFYVKEGAGTTPYQYGTDPSGINSVVAKGNASSTATYNLAGQRISKEYKGIVVKDGKKVMVK